MSDRQSQVRSHLAEAIVAAGRRLAARGLIAGGEGNLSIRLAEGELLITPAGRRKDELRVEELVRVGLDGSVDGRVHGRIVGPADDRATDDRPAAHGRPSSDLALHVAVYRARPDVIAYVHAHVPAAMALTLAGRAPDPSALPETAMLLPRLPVVPLATPGSEELAQALAAALSAPPEPPADAALLARHGAVAVGSGDPSVDAEAALAAAVDRMELIDVLCRVWQDAVLLGLDPAQARDSPIRG